MTMTTETRRRAFELRAHGFTYPQIARSLGLTSTNQADYAVQSYCRDFGHAVPGHSTARSEAARRAAATRYSGGTTTGRRFGVEIEVIGLSVMDAFIALREAGLPITQPTGNSNYNHANHARNWKVVYDGSVSQGCEVVSPPLKGDGGFTSIQTAMKALVAAGARINRSCGLHVHHEVADMTGDEIARVIETYAAHQGTMDALVAPSRRNATYTRHFEAYEVSRLTSAFRSISGRGTRARTAIRSHGIGGRPEARYRVVNVHSYPTYGTLEFRQHQGTLNAAKTKAWVLLGQAIIAAAKADTALTSDLIPALAAAGHLPQDAAGFLADRAATLA